MSESRWWVQSPPPQVLYQCPHDGTVMWGYGWNGGTHLCSVSDRHVMQIAPPEVAAKYTTAVEPYASEAAKKANRPVTSTVHPPAKRRFGSWRR